MSSWKDGKKAQEEEPEFKLDEHPQYMPNHFKGGRENVRSKYHFPAFAKPLTNRARFEKAQKELGGLMKQLQEKRDSDGKPVDPATETTVPNPTPESNE